MYSFKSLYRHFTALSLDIVAGAVGTCYAICQTSGLTPSTILYIVLGLSVWVIYTTDHLIDVKKTTEKTFRHQFHREHFNLILILDVVAVIVLSVLLTQIGKELILGGVVISGALSAFRLLEIFAQWKTKSWTTAIFYVLGLMLIPYILGIATPFVHLMILLPVAILNTLFLQFLDASQAATDGRISNVLSTMHTLRIFLLTAVLIFPYLLSRDASLIWLIFYGISWLVFVFMFRFRVFILGNKEAGRWISDGIFLLPALLIHLQ